MKKRIKQIIGVIIGIIIGISTTVGATTIFNSKDITYSSDKTSKTNVKDSLDELYTNLGKCPEGLSCVNLKLNDVVDLGDYISMTPTSTSYTISKDLTGYTSDQTINPSELNIWRVISKNEDGTIDVISEYTCNECISFNDKTGYMNLAGGLNLVATQYTNTKYVSKTRNVGYSNQIEYCNEVSETSCPKDTGYESDLDLINEAIGTLYTKNLAGGEAFYWLASRNYFLDGVNRANYTGQSVEGDHLVTGNVIAYQNADGSWGGSSFLSSVTSCFNVENRYQNNKW